MTRTVLEVENLNFAYEDESVLQDISFRIREGETFTVVGPNGSGKTTLLKCLNRILEPQSGTVRLAGEDLRKQSRRRIAERIAYVPQTRGRNIPFSVKEFVKMGRYPFVSQFGQNRKVDRSIISNVMEMTGVEELQNRWMNRLSGGEEQRVFIAAALAQEPEILLLDEPTTFLDPGQEHDILSLLKKINRERETTLVTVTHDINLAGITARRVLALRDGQIAYLGSPEGVMEKEVLQTLFDRTFHQYRHPVTGSLKISRHPEENGDTS